MRQGFTREFPREAHVQIGSPTTFDARTLTYLLQYRHIVLTLARMESMVVYV